MLNMYHIEGKIVQMDGDSGLEKFTVGPNKARKPNWTENEVLLLLEEYSRRRHFMKPKFGTMVPMTERQKCWGEIADVINTSEGINGCYRSVKEVQKKWENLSNRMRFEFATAKVDATFRLSETSVAINNILNGDGTFDSGTFSKGYKLVKQEKCDEEEYTEIDDDSYQSEEPSEEAVNGSRETLPVLNIPFKANNRFQKSLESYVPIAPRPNQTYSSLMGQSSNDSKPRSSQEGEVVFPSGDSVFVTSPIPVSSQSKTDQNRHLDNTTAVKDKPNPETSAKLKEVMLKRSNQVNSVSESGPPDKKIKLEKSSHVCPVFSDESVTKLYKQVLILKKQTLKSNLKKIELEKEKLKLETEKLKIEKETAKINKDKVLTEFVATKQKLSAFL